MMDTSGLFILYFIAMEIFLRLTFVPLLLAVLLISSWRANGQDCTPISPGSSTSPLDAAVSIIKGGNYYQLFDTSVAPAAADDFATYSIPGLEALQAAKIIIGIVVELFSGSCVFNSASNGCWNVEGNYGFPDGRMINYGCDFGVFTEVNYKFGGTSPDSDGWSQIAAEPSGIPYCLYAGTSPGDPLFTTNCDSSDDRQKFKFLPVGGADFLFIHKATSQCLYLASDGIRTTTCNIDDGTQLFRWCDHVTSDCVVPSSVFNPC